VDSGLPLFTRLIPISQQYGFGDDWRVPRELPSDIGARPELATLGPYEWQPQPALDWTLSDVNAVPRSLHDFRGRPVIVVFYLGHGCLHCAEQLQAMAKAWPQFQAAGLDIIAISTDKAEDLSKAYENLDGGFPFGLVSDSELSVFRHYRCYDDFEKTPLHGTFLVDSAGRIRWQDIGFEPFNDPAFVIAESKRLLSIDPGSASDAIESGAAD
jgi:peroxiredoxin